MKVPLDPFLFKKYSKLNPRRLIFTAYARYEEKLSRFNFERYQIPEALPPHFERSLELRYAVNETAVTEEQMRLLIAALAATEQLGGAVVEVGAYRGATTAVLAPQTSRKYLAVDPYSGYGGAESDCEAMLKRTAGIANVEHLRFTSGEAVALIREQSISFVFVDAVHDFVNARFDSVSWGGVLMDNGLIAFHDTDSVQFAGVQRAVKELLVLSGSFYLFGHVSGLVILQKRRAKKCT